MLQKAAMALIIKTSEPNEVVAVNTKPMGVEEILHRQDRQLERFAYRVTECAIVLKTWVMAQSRPSLNDASKPNLYDGAIELIEDSKVGAPSIVDVYIQTLQSIMFSKLGSVFASSNSIHVMV